MPAPAAANGVNVSRKARKAAMMERYVLTTFFWISGGVCGTGVNRACAPLYCQRSLPMAVLRILDLGFQLALAMRHEVEAQSWVLADRKIEIGVEIQS